MQTDISTRTACFLMCEAELVYAATDAAIATLLAQLKQKQNEISDTATEAMNIEFATFSEYEDGERKVNEVID